MMSSYKMARTYKLILCAPPLGGLETRKKFTLMTKLRIDRPLPRSNQRTAYRDRTLLVMQNAHLDHFHFFLKLFLYCLYAIFNDNVPRLSWSQRMLHPDRYLQLTWRREKPWDHVVQSSPYTEQVRKIHTR